MHCRFSLRGLFCAMLVAALLAPACHKQEIPVDNMAIVNKAIYDTASNFYVEFDQYPSELRNLPIGVFDSGVGGLTCVKELTKLLPHEDIVYLGDTARVPYGTRSKETIARYTA